MLLPAEATPSAPLTTVDVTDPRRLHYGEFYGLRPLPEGDGPLAVVWGNCQAESLRVLLEGSPDRPYRTVRVPPVHEIEPGDLPHLARVLEQTAVLVAQPVAAGYRGMPLGTADVAAGLGRGRTVVLFPVIRNAALFPAHALVRVAGDPPVAPYHDLRTLLEAAGDAGPARPPSVAAVRAVAEHSLGQLRARERRHGTVTVSDLLLSDGAGSAHTLNHPGNVVLVGTARRVQEAAGWPVAARDPGRVLLGSVLAPLEDVVLEALGLEGEPRPGWLVQGVAHSAEQVREAHLGFYRAHPEVVPAGLARHAEQLRLLALPGLP